MWPPGIVLFLLSRQSVRSPTKQSVCRRRVRVRPQCKTPVCESDPLALSPMFKHHYCVLLLLLLQAVNATPPRMATVVWRRTRSAGNGEESPCILQPHRPYSSVASGLYSASISGRGLNVSVLTGWKQMTCPVKRACRRGVTGCKWNNIGNGGGSDISIRK